MKKRIVIAAFFIFALVISVGVFYFPKQTAHPQEPEKVAKAFYSWYINCNRARMEGKTQTGEDCSYEKSEYVTKKLVEKLNEIYATFTGGGGDLIVCAQNIPTSFKVEQNEVHNGKALVYVYEYFGETSQNKIEVYLELIDNKWRIIDIVCPTPGS